MTIEYVEGNLLESDAELLVNPVNCVGVSGKGLALQFATTFPNIVELYKRDCRSGILRPGNGVVHVGLRDTKLGPTLVANFPTKRHWRDDSRIDDIYDGLQWLTGFVRGHGIKSVAIPPLGCGLGNLSWSSVRPMIEEAFADQPDVRVLVYGKGG